MAQGWKSNVVLSPAAHIAFLRALAAQEDALAQAPSQTGFSSRPLPAHVSRELRHSPSVFVYPLLLLFPCSSKKNKEIEGKGMAKQESSKR